MTNKQKYPPFKLEQFQKTGLAAIQIGDFVEYNTDENGETSFAFAQRAVIQICKDIDEELYKAIVDACVEKGIQTAFIIDRTRVAYAIKKQIPKKPIGDLHSVPHYRCAMCGGGVKAYEDSPVYPFCHNCGQALDWSD